MHSTLIHFIGFAPPCSCTSFLLPPSQSLFLPSLKPYPLGGRSSAFYLYSHFFTLLKIRSKSEITFLGFQSIHALFFMVPLWSMLPFVDLFICSIYADVQHISADQIWLRSILFPVHYVHIPNSFDASPTALKNATGHMLPLLKCLSPRNSYCNFL